MNVRTNEPLPTVTAHRITKPNPKPMRSVNRALLTTLGLTLLPQAHFCGQASILADSEAEFSSVQGQDNWQYGYYDGPFVPSDFQPMPNYDTAFGFWYIADGSGGYWTRLTSAGGHPNGLNGNNGRRAENQWAVRRWTSEVDGLLTISGEIADFSPLGGNGIIAHIFVGGAEVYTHVLDTWGASHSFSFSASVPMGTTVDFAIDPRDGDDGNDTTRFNAQIAAVPEPVATGVLAGLGLAGFAAWRRTVGRREREGQ